MKKTTGFLGTYYDPDSVLRLERWVRIVAWVTLILYVLDAANSFYQTIMNSIINGFPIDFYFILNTTSRIFVGAVLFMLLQSAARVMLILMDIEDNTRRGARGNSKQDQG